MIKQDLACDGVMRAEDTHFGYTVVKFCTGLNEGKHFYAFVAIEPQDLPYFDAHYKAGEHSHFKPFGAELLRGWGTEAPQHVITHIQNKYGVYFCKDERSTAALVQLIQQNLVNSDLTMSNDTASRLTTPKKESFIDFCKRSLEKPARLSGL